MHARALLPQGAEHWNWNPSRAPNERAKDRPCAVPQWRTAVFQRDDYTCQACLERGRKLNAHHIVPYSTDPSLVLDPDNGITLCRTCHTAYHAAYAIKDVNRETLREFMNHGQNS
jgi:5-methylcytosine-specific restriction endonuclease McrA